MTTIDLLWHFTLTPDILHASNHDGYEPDIIKHLEFEPLIFGGVKDSLIMGLKRSTD